MLTEIQLARHAQNDAASDTMVSDEEIEPHLAAVDRISVTSSEYHDCLPDTAEEARRQGCAIEFVLVIARWAGDSRTTQKSRTNWALRPDEFAADLARIPDRVQAKEVLTLPQLGL